MPLIGMAERLILIISELIASSINYYCNNNDDTYEMIIYIVSSESLPAIDLHSHKKIPHLRGQ